MKKYCLLFIFGNKEVSKDQVLLVKKRQGLNKDWYNGLGKRIEHPQEIYEILKELKIPLFTDGARVQKTTVLAYPHAQVYCYGVYLENDLTSLLDSLDAVDKYWILHPKDAIRWAFNGKNEIKEDLAYLLPLAMDENIRTTIITKEMDFNTSRVIIQRINDNQ